MCLSPLESLQHFCHSSQSFQRLAYSQVGHEQEGNARTLFLAALLPPASYTFTCLVCAQGIAAAAAAASCCYQDCVEVLLPLAQQLLRDPEAEIRATVVKQLAGLGKCFSWVATPPAAGVCMGRKVAAAPPATLDPTP